jgi:hypothetical protein
MRPVLEARHLGRQSKHVLYIQKIQQIPRLTEEYMDTWPGHIGGAGPHYIRRLRVTEEYILIYSSVTCDRRIYSYIPQYRGI